MGGLAFGRANVLDQAMKLDLEIVAMAVRFAIRCGYQVDNAYLPKHPSELRVLEKMSGGHVLCEEMMPGSNWLRKPSATWPAPQGRPVKILEQP